jgi:phage FluMu gp28-like protein
VEGAVVSEAYVVVEPVEISKGEKKDLLDLVEECQQTRMTHKLPIDQIPAILLPYQIRWNQDMARVRIGEKSRRIGFSWGCIAAEGALEAAAQHGMNQYYMGYNIGMAAENIGDARTFAEAYGMVVSSIDVSREREVLGDKKQDITRFRLTFNSGYIYEALSSSPYNWRGRQGHARIDEAAFHRNLQEVIKGAMAFLMWGGRVDIISTHNSEENDFYQLCQQVKSGKLPYSLHYIDFDKAISEGLYQRICLVTGKDWTPEGERAWRDEQFASYPDQADANEELLCIAKKGSGAYFTRLLLKQCMIQGVPVIRWSKPPEWVTCETRIEEAKEWIKDVLKPILDNMTDHSTVYGQDFGRDADLSNTWLMQKRDPARWTMAVMIDLRCIPFDVQALIRDYVLDNVPKLQHAAFDARGNGQSHAEGALQKIGSTRVSCIKATAQFYDEWFPKYRQAYEDRSFLVADCEDIITDHRRVVLVRGRPTMDEGHDKGEDGLKRHGDSAIGGLMAYVATNLEASIIEYNPMPNKNTRYWQKPERDDDELAIPRKGAW